MREAEPIDGDYEIPLAPVLQLPVPIVHNAPAPVLNHVVQAIPAPAPFAAPIPTPNFLPVNQVFAPEQFAFVPAPAPQPILNQAAFAPAPIAAPAPLPLAAPAPLPLAAPVPVVPIVEPPSSQFHAQDEFGQFSFGYQNINSAKTETKDAFGVTRGSYQYVDANGVLQTVNYIADDVNGFRVAGTNIPVAPEAVAIAGPVAPEETPEVAAARAEHLAAHAEAQANSVEKREAEPIDGDYEIPLAPVLQLPVPIVHNAPAPVLNHVVQAIPAPAPFAAPIPTPNFLPVNQVFAPEQFAFVPAPAPH